MRLCELREKEVINICDGKRLGCIVDLEFDVCTGKIEAVIIPGPGKIWGFLQIVTKGYKKKSPEMA